MYDIPDYYDPIPNDISYSDPVDDYSLKACQFCGELTCESCTSSCTSGCTTSCEDMCESCQVSCTSGCTGGCENACEFDCQSCLTCQASCTYCQDECELVCMQNMGATRPDDWQWSFNIVQGGPVYDTQIINGVVKAYIMPHTEWNSFLNRINEFRVYKGLSAYNFTYVSPEEDCTVDIINIAINAINPIGNFGLPNVTGPEVPSSAFINMRDALNSIA